MKQIQYKLVYLFLLFIVASCSNDDLPSLNENPNNPEVVPTSTIFNHATKRFMDNSRNGFGSGRLTLPWMQYWGQNDYSIEDRYLYRESTALDLWIYSYLAANNFKQIIDINVDEQTRDQQSLIGGNNENQIAVSRIMLSYIFNFLVTTFGAIPYYSYGSDNENFQGLNIDQYPTPKFATELEITLDILKELRESADMISASSLVIGSDNIYGGVAVKWKKFANSLILRIATRLKSISGNESIANNAIERAIADGVFTSNEDNAVQKYEKSDANGSPFWRSFIDRSDFGVASTFVTLLKGETGSFGQDPRLFEMVAPTITSIESVKQGRYTPSDKPEDYDGIPYAFSLVNQLSDSTWSWPSSRILRPDYGEVLMEYAEVAFLLSEHKNWDQTEYNNGVRASMERWGVSDDSTISSFINHLPAASKENVLTQKYIALYMQPHISWAEYRRTGFPSTDILLLPGETATLTPEQAKKITSGTSGTYTFKALVSGIDIADLPSRLRYPQSLQTLNGANRAEAVRRLEGGDIITSKLIWDVN